jgi:hypothetical protein
MVVALRALKIRGVLSDSYIKNHRDEISKAMDPLPPPWEWERLRLLTGLPATAMEKRSGVHHMRIRHWEKGGGTASEELWVQYADSLADVTIARGFNLLGRTASGADQRPVNASIQALVEQQRVTSNALTVWVSQGFACEPGDIMLLLDAVRQSREKIMSAQRVLRDRLRQSSSAGQAQEKGRKDNDNGTTH